MFQKIGITLLLFAAFGSSAWALTDEDIYYRAGNTLYLRGCHTLSVPFYKAVIEADPQNWKAYQALGGCEFRLNEVNQALQDYKMSLQLNPANKELLNFVNSISNLPPVPLPGQGNAKFTDIYYRAGNTLYLKNCYILAIPYYRAVIEADPKNWKAYQALGGCEFRLGRKDDAVRMYKMSLAANPNNPQLQNFVTQLAAPPVTQAAAPPVVSVDAPPPPKAVDDYRLPRQGSMTWELSTGLTFNGTGDLTKNYAPLTVNTAGVAPIAEDFDFGADYTVNPNLQLGAQFQFISKQNVVIYDTYSTVINGSTYLATNTTTWSEACLGGALDGKYLISLNNDFRLIFNGQAGYYSLAGSSYVYQGSSLTTLNLSGSSLGGLIETKLEWVLDQGGWALDLGLGYRILSFNTITYTNPSNNQSQVFTNGNGGNVTFDFSGPRVSLAARFF
jgi:tetratricopeptide (TPR) repeat protein